jgi:hypothetical protein
MVCFLGYGENHSWTRKSCLWELPYAKALILPPQHRFDAPRAKHRSDAPIGVLPKLSSPKLKKLVGCL